MAARTRDRWTAPGPQLTGPPGPVAGAVGQLHLRRRIPARRDARRRRIVAAVDSDVNPIANARQHGHDQQRLQRVHKFVLPDDTGEGPDARGGDAKDRGGTTPERPT